MCLPEGEDDVCSDMLEYADTNSAGVITAVPLTAGL